MDIGNLDNVFGNISSSNINNINKNVNNTTAPNGKNTLGQVTSLEDMMAQVGDYDDTNATPSGPVDQDDNDDDDDSDDDKPEEKETPISKPDDRTAIAAQAILNAAVKEPTSTTATVTQSKA